MTIIETDRFEWDDHKAAENQSKLRVSFEYATKIFDDPEALTLPDQRHDYGEDRMKLIGQASDGGTLAVIFTQRSNRIRIISSPPANKMEREIYAHP